MAEKITNVAQLDGLFKEVYADKIENLIPDYAKLIKQIPFSIGDKIGDGFHQPVILTQSHGVTYAAPSSSAFALKDPIAMTTKDAIVDGFQMLLRDRIGYESAAKAASSKTAFIRTTAIVVENMLESITKRLEIDIIYGQIGIGQAISSVNAGGTETVVQLSTATWASGIWTGGNNANINFFKVSDGTAVGVTGAATNVFAIKTIDVSNRKLTVTASTDDIADLDTHLATSDDADIFWDGSKGNQMAGLDKIITNTSILFSIDAAIFDLWKGSTSAVGGVNFTFDKLDDGLSIAVGKGLDEDVLLVMSPATWGTLNSDVAGRRRHDTSYKPGMANEGNKMLEYNSQNGMITFVPHAMCKEGEAFLFPKKRAKRIGAQDISFNNPGTGDRFFRELTDNAGFELRVYENQSLFIETPAKTLKFDGIVN